MSRLNNIPKAGGCLNICFGIMLSAIAVFPLVANSADQKNTSKQQPEKRLLTQSDKTPATKTQPAKKKPVKLRGPVRLGTTPRRRQNGVPNVGGNVQVQALARIDAASIGSMAPKDDGFPANMWRGMSRQKLISLIPYLPAGGASPTIRQLFRRLLLTSAIAPKGNREDGIALLAARVRKLAEAGHLSDVEALVRQLPPALAGEDLLDARLDALLFSGDTATACKLASAQVQQTPNARWNKKIAFCHAIRGEIDRAELLEGRLREQDPKDKSFFELLSVLIDPKAQPLKSLERSEPLHLAMLRASQRPVPANALSGAGPAALGMFSTMDSVSGRDRRRAALDAHHWGLIDDDALRFAFTVTDSAGSPKIGGKKARAKTRKRKRRKNKTTGIEVLGRLQVSALYASDETERITIFNKAYGWGRQAGRSRSTITLFSDLLGQIAPNSQLAGFAETAIRAYLVLGDSMMALKWYDKVAKDPALAMEVLRRKLSPYFILAGTKAKKYTKRGTINRWWLNEIAQGTKSRFERGALIASLFDALGERTPRTLWRALYDGPSRENTLELTAALRRDLRRAAGNGRLGETVLISLIALQDDGMARLGAGSLSDLVGALSKVGLKKEAFALTSEILLVRGF